MSPYYTVSLIQVVSPKDWFLAPDRELTIPCGAGAARIFVDDRPDIYIYIYIHIVYYIILDYAIIYTCII